MFHTLLASRARGAPWTRPVVAAFLFHMFLIVVAAGGTASHRARTSPVGRDTIRLEMIEVIPSGPKNADAPPSRSDPLIPAPPSIPAISLRAPEFRLPSFSFNPSGPSESTRASVERHSGKSPVSVGSPGSVFGTTEVDQLPELTEELHPRYPAALKRAGVSGFVRVEYVVGTDGRVDIRSVRVVASTHPGFLIAAVQALHGARFRPARRGGRPAAVLVQQTIRFLQR